ncbi:MAG: ABC transporter permease [Erysipelothrix sp.]|nr:ABC transporter permease [Erysipelothrix sp.]
MLTAIRQHILISLVSVTLGFLSAFPLGIYLSKHKRLAQWVLNISSIVNTIPSLVLLGVAMIFLGLGFWTAVSVLYIYSLLPILRNTTTGLMEVDSQYVKIAKGLGMTSWQILWKVEIPLALPTIVSGVRMSAVYIISWATLAALIGAGGLGDLIWMGLQSYNFDLIFAGSIPATMMALLVSFSLGLIERLVAKHSQGGTS